eukprot:2076540-Pyramimonas_sp.AAC.1
MYAMSHAVEHLIQKPPPEKLGQSFLAKRAYFREHVRPALSLQLAQADSKTFAGSWLRFRA